MAEKSEKIQQQREKSKRREKFWSHLELSLFFRELSLLFESGVGLGEALFIMETNAGERDRAARCKTMGEKIDEGNTLSDALAASGKFPTHALQMVQIGQTSGKLESVLRGLSVYYERQYALQRTVKSVLTYPLVMIAVMFCVLSVLIIKVLPLFGAVFQETGAPMPLLLRLTTQSRGFSLGLILILLAILIFLAVTFISAGKGLAAGNDSGGIFARLPFMKSIFHKTEAGNFAYSMSLLLAGGVALDSAVEIAADMTASSWAKEKLALIRRNMTEGKTFAAAVMQADFLEGTFSALLAAGEKAGRTDAMMDLIADRYTDEIDSKINSLLAVVEPTLVIVMSVVIGGILLSIMLPLMNIMTSV